MLHKKSKMRKCKSKKKMSSKKLKKTRDKKKITIRKQLKKTRDKKKITIRKQLKKTKKLIPNKNKKVLRILGGAAAADTMDESVTWIVCGALVDGECKIFDLGQGQLKSCIENDKIHDIINTHKKKLKDAIAITKLVANMSADKNMEENMEDFLNRLEEYFEDYPGNQYNEAKHAAAMVSRQNVVPNTDYILTRASFYSDNDDTSRRLFYTHLNDVLPADIHRICLDNGANGKIVYEDYEGDNWFVRERTQSGMRKFEKHPGGLGKLLDMGGGTMGEVQEPSSPDKYFYASHYSNLTFCCEISKNGESSCTGKIKITDNVTNDFLSIDDMNMSEGKMISYDIVKTMLGHDSNGTASRINKQVIDFILDHFVDLETKKTGVKDMSIDSFDEMLTMIYATSKPFGDIFQLIDSYYLNACLLSTDFGMIISASTLRVKNIACFPDIENIATLINQYGGGPEFVYAPVHVVRCNPLSAGKTPGYVRTAAGGTGDVQYTGSIQDYIIHHPRSTSQTPHFDLAAAIDRERPNANAMDLDLDELELELELIKKVLKQEERDDIALCTYLHFLFKEFDIELPNFIHKGEKDIRRLTSYHWMDLFETKDNLIMFCIINSLIIGEGPIANGGGGGGGSQQQFIGEFNTYVDKLKELVIRIPYPERASRSSSQEQRYLPLLSAFIETDARKEFNAIVKTVYPLCLKIFGNSLKREDVVNKLQYLIKTFFGLQESELPNERSAGLVQNLQNDEYRAGYYEDKKGIFLQHLNSVNAAYYEFLGKYFNIGNYSSLREFIGNSNFSDMTVRLNREIQDILDNLGKEGGEVGPVPLHQHPNLAKFEENVRKLQYEEIAKEINENLKKNETVDNTGLLVMDYNTNDEVWDEVWTNHSNPSHSTQILENLSKKSDAAAAAETHDELITRSHTAPPSIRQKATGKPGKESPTKINRPVPYP